MSKRFYKKLVILLAYGALAGALPVSVLPKLRPTQQTEFARSAEDIRAYSPNGKASITVKAPRNEDEDPRMVARSGNVRLSLGEMRRSASVFWRPDSEAAALWDRADSNRFYVRLVRTKPSLSEVRGFDALIRQAVLREFRGAEEVVHYWVAIKGWTEGNDLLVSVCADGIPKGAPQNTPMIGFDRGYVIDTNRVKIRQRLSSTEFTTVAGANPCE